MILGFDPRDFRTAWNLLRMHLRDRHLGTTLGLAWSAVHPLILMSVYTFVFGVLFKARLPGAETSLSYAAWLISGLGPWLATSEAITSGASAIVGNSALVKNVPLKTELLPISSALTGVVTLTITLMFLLVLLAFGGGKLSWAILYLPVAVVLQFLFIIGICLFLAPITVFMRDVQHVLPSVLMVVMFLTPIFYVPDMMPWILPQLSAFNPFYVISESYGAPLIAGTLPPLWHAPYMLVLSGLLWYGGLKVFRRVKLYFDSVL